MIQKHAQVQTISLREHPQLLGLLSTQTFRRELAKSPGEVLARFGVHFDSTELPGPVSLPKSPNKIDVANYGLI